MSIFPILLGAIILTPRADKEKTFSTLRPCSWGINRVGDWLMNGYEKDYTCANLLLLLTLFLELGLMSHPVDQAQGRRRTPLTVPLPLWLEPERETLGETVSHLAFSFPLLYLWNARNCYTRNPLSPPLTTHRQELRICG